jgi:predicted RNA-binding protein with RPS1 domain
MAGGEGAKERRRLKRLKGGGSSDDTKAVETTTTTASSLLRGTTNGRKEGAGSYKRSGALSKESRRLEEGKDRTSFSGAKRDHGSKRKSSSGDNDNISNRGKSTGKESRAGDSATFITTKKVTKPKHLKRKLQQASQDGEEHAREVLRKRLEEWEDRKVLLLSKKQPKRQKRMPLLPSKNEPNDNVDVVDDEPASFPRNNLHTKDEGLENPGNHLASVDAHNSSSVVHTQRVDGTENLGRIDDKPCTTSDDNRDSETKAAKRVMIVGTAIANNGGAVTSSPLNKSVEDNSDDGDSENGDDDDDDDSNMEDGMEVRRQRGRGRRGRKDTAAKVEEMQSEKLESKLSTTTHHEENDCGLAEGSSANGPAHAVSTKEGKRDEKDDRYCLGRKPVSDFILGQSYPARVVYVKPFGVFLDIGCHSDAFCHVSRLSDAFVESPEELYKEGDHIAGARVVEIDRKQKRITVSLQSEARILDERASIEARRSRKDTRKSKAQSKGGRPLHASKNRIPLNGQADTKGGVENQEAPSHRAETKGEFNNQHAPSHRAGVEPNFEKRQLLAISKPSMSGDPSIQSPAEQKRARKLARRAARREQADPAA